MDFDLLLYNEFGGEQLPVDRALYPQLVKGGFCTLGEVMHVDIPIELQILLSLGPKFVFASESRYLDTYRISVFLRAS